jgi:amino acid permease
VENFAGKNRNLKLKNFKKNGIMPDAKTLKTFILPFTIMVNTTVGIGIFALPFVVSKAGILISMAYFVVLGAAAISIHLMFAEISLATPDYKRMPGFAKIHLGRWAEIYEYFSIMLGFLASLAAFIIIGGEFLFEICGPIFGGSQFFYNMAYGLAGAILVYLGINIVSRIGFWGLIIFLAIFTTIIAKGLPLINFDNFTLAAANPRDLFLPYGAILYSLWASSSIPEVEEMLGRKNRKDLLKKTVFVSGITAALVYLFFSLTIAGITGNATTPSALIGLKDIFGAGISNLLFFFGLVTSFTSFIIMGLTLKKVLAYDCGLNKNIAWTIAAIGPLALVAAGLNDFVSIFGVVGGIVLGIDAILILLMYQKIKPDKKNLAYPLFLIFGTGIILEILHIFN